jgi:hypothetical protein
MPLARWREYSRAKPDYLLRHLKCLSCEPAQLACRGYISEVKTMAKEPMLHRTVLLALGATALLLAGCVSAPGTYPDPNGPRDGDGLLVDPQTGIVLPGQSDVGF